jgi:cytochrome P450
VASPELTLDPTLLAGPMQDPAPFIARLREQDPVCWIPGLDAWLVTRHEDVQRLFSDPRVTADARVYERYRAPSTPEAARWLAQPPFRSTSGESQSLGRRLVSAAFTRRAAERMEDRVREVVAEVSAPLRVRRDVVDLVPEFTAPISATVIGRILGVPTQGDDEMRFRQLARNATRLIWPFLSEPKRRKTDQAVVEISEYVLGLVAERRKSPQEDMISDLLHASESDPGASDDDIGRVVSGVVAAGTGTTSVACARALRALMKHPEQLALLRRERALLPNAVGELLRYDSGLIAMPRYVQQQFELRGRSLRKGQLVVLSLMGANRDPRVFDEPDVLDLRRETKDSLSFGQGPHYCIGANLALVEMRSMIDAALDFLPAHPHLLEDQIRWTARGLMSQLRSLPVDFSA